MAHPCIECGGECYCHGDIDDCIVSKTPKNCEGCGCSEFFSDENDLEDDPVGYCCLGCGHVQDHGGECEMCAGNCVEPYG